MKKRYNKKTFKLVSLFLSVAIVVTMFASCGLYGNYQSIDKDINDEEIFEKLDIIDKLFQTYSLFELDEEALMDAVIEGYISATGDEYAEYYSEEEYAKIFSENKGELVGIGIRVVKNLDTQYIEITNVMPDTPAFKAGVLPGDLITEIRVNGESYKVEETGYTLGVELLGGTEGSVCEFSAIRKTDTTVQTVDFSIKREKIESESVMSRVFELDSTVGIIRILEFNLVTPTQLSEAVDKLIASGCDKFIFDVRNNPGGDLKSIQAVLSYFLEEDDVYVRVSNRSGAFASYKVSEVEYYDEYSGCSVSKNDIGKYRDLDFAVLVNDKTVSAAELFTGTIKDSGISLIVGTKTYGKGTIQTIYSLSQFGYSGYIKMTTKYYYPPISESYNKKGIEPDVTVELDPSLENKNIYTLTDAEDNQLIKAVEELYKKINKN